MKWLCVCVDICYKLNALLFYFLFFGGSHTDKEIFSTKTELLYVQGHMFSPEAKKKKFPFLISHYCLNAVSLTFIVSCGISDSKQEMRRRKEGGKGEWSN